jgi:hypothetical protein
MVLKPDEVPDLTDSSNQTACSGLIEFLLLLGRKMMPVLTPIRVLAQRPVLEQFVKR